MWLWVMGLLLSPVSVKSYSPSETLSVSYHMQACEPYCFKLIQTYTDFLRYIIKIWLNVSLETKCCYYCVCKYKTTKSYLKQTEKLFSNFLVQPLNLNLRFHFSTKKNQNNIFFIKVNQQKMWDTCWHI